MTIKMSACNWMLISYKNPNPMLTLLKEDLSSRGIHWMDDPDSTQPMLERVKVLHISHADALVLGQMYSCEVWSCS